MTNEAVVKDGYIRSQCFQRLRVRVPFCEVLIYSCHNTPEILKRTVPQFHEKLSTLLVIDISSNLEAFHFTT